MFVMLYCHILAWIANSFMNLMEVMQNENNLRNGLQRVQFSRQL